MLRSVVTFVLVAVAASSSVGRAAQAPPAAVAGASSDVASAVERLRVDGFAALYSLDYATAGRMFDEIVRVAPDRPQGYLYRATNLWFKSLYDKRLLSLSLYAQDEFYEQKEKKVDPVVDRAFRADVQKAIATAEARLAANAKDVDALYYLGAAHGALGGYEATMAHAFVSALKHGSKSVETHEQTLKLDPTYEDAYLTLGMYHYVVGSLPFVVKITVALGGVRGSKRDGLAELERVAKSGRRNSDDARVLLAGLYARENRLADSLATLRELKAKYPANYIVGIEEASTLVKLGRFDESYAAFDRLVETPRARAEARDFVEYAYGDALFRGGRHEAALAHFAEVGRFKGADPDLVTLARLGAGQCHDALGRRAAALAEYRAVMARPDVLDSRKRAERFSKTAYAPSSPMASTGQL
jgi:tetratricopeptide (TPR) repeat protein